MVKAGRGEVSLVAEASLAEFGPYERGGGDLIAYPELHLTAEKRASIELSVIKPRTGSKFCSLKTCCWPEPNVSKVGVIDKNCALELGNAIELRSINLLTFTPRNE